MPRARRSGGNISAAAARVSWIVAPGAAEQREADGDERGRAQGAAARDDAAADGADREAAADHRHPADAVHEPPGRPDGDRARREEDRRAESENPRDAGDRDERQRAERRRELEHARVADEPAGEQECVPLDRCSDRDAHATSIRSRPSANATAPPCDGWRTYGASSTVAAIRPTATTRRPRRQLVEERPGRAYLRARRPPVRRSRAWMRRHDVPQQHVVLDSELAEHAVHDRRARLRRARAGQLALRGEGDAADARAAIPGRLADEDDRRSRVLLEIRARAVRAAAGNARTGCASRRCACGRAGRRDPRREPSATRSLRSCAHYATELAAQSRNVVSAPPCTDLPA